MHIQTHTQSLEVIIHDLEVQNLVSNSTTHYSIWRPLKQILSQSCSIHNQLTIIHHIYMLNYTLLPLLTEY